MTKEQTGYTHNQKDTLIKVYRAIALIAVITSAIILLGFGN